jgi:putative multiple sugar transport system substrate-binding protein
MDSRELVSATVDIIQSVLAEGESPINDTTTYDNNVFIVPSVILGITHVDINNWHEVLIGSEYYTEDMFTIP